MAGDPWAAALLKAEAPQIGRKLKIVTEFGDRPDLLDAIRSLRRDRRMSAKAIAQNLTEITNVRISEGAVKNWLAEERIP